MSSGLYELDVEEEISMASPAPTPPEVTVRHSPPRLMVFSSTSASELEAMLPQWQELVANAVEASAAGEPAVLLPALQAAGASVRIVYVAMADEAGGVQRLLGVFPLHCAHEFCGRRATVLQLWNPTACATCVPLIHRDMAEACLDAFFAWLRAQARNLWLMEFANIPAAGAFCRALLLHQRASGESIYRARRADDGAYNPLAITLLYPTGHYGSDLLLASASLIQLTGRLQPRGRIKP